MFPVLHFILDEMRQVPFRSFSTINRTFTAIVDVEVDLRRVEVVRVDQLIQLLVAEWDIERRIVRYGDRIPDVFDDLEFVCTDVGRLRKFLHFGRRKQQDVVILDDFLLYDRLPKQAVANAVKKTRVRIKLKLPSVLDAEEIGFCFGFIQLLMLSMIVFVCANKRKIFVTENTSRV